MGGCCEAQTKIWYDWVKNMPSMKGKVVAITGCTSGTGKVLAEACAKKGATVVLLNRPSARADKALNDVAEAAESVGAPKPVSIPCDLMSFKSVQAAGQQMSSQFSANGLDVLVNNAGIMGFQDVATEDGCDQQMQVNHLSHFMLTSICMPALEAAGRLRGEARIVNHSSAARAMDGMENNLDQKYLEKNGGNLGGNSEAMFAGPQFQRYQQTKLANVVFTDALNTRLAAKNSPVKALVAHPGVALDTGLSTQTFATGGVTPPPGFMMALMGTFLTQTEQDATVGILRQTCDPAAVSGEFFGPLGSGGGTGKHDTGEYKGAVGVLKAEPLSDKKAQDMLWTVSEQSTGTKFVL